MVYIQEVSPVVYISQWQDMTLTIKLISMFRVYDTLHNYTSLDSK